MAPDWVVRTGRLLFLLVSGKFLSCFSQSMLAVGPDADRPGGAGIGWLHPDRDLTECRMRRTMAVQ
jgi:hypothetical protein